MGVFGAVFGTAAKTAKAGVFGNVAQRMIVGGGVGGIIGATGHESQRNTALGAIKGAAVGAVGAGLFGARIFKKAGSKLPSINPGLGWKGATLGVQAVAKTAWKGAPVAGRAARFALEHPLLVGGAAGTVALGSAVYPKISGAQSLESPTMTGATVNTNYARQEAAVEALGGSLGSGRVGTATGLRPANRSFTESTYGLAQGLYKMRHG